MCSVARKLGTAGNCSLSALLDLRLVSLPVVIEYLSLSTFDHDVSLVAYLKRFPGGLWPHLTTIPCNALYVLWSPLHSHVYAGRTVDFNRRHTDHTFRIHNPGATGQIPAYFFFREKVHSELPAVASFFMLPVVAVDGGVHEAVAAERVFLGNFCFKLNTPHVYRHLSHEALELVNPSLARRRKILGPAVPLRAPQSHSPDQALLQCQRPMARHLRKQRGFRAVGMLRLPSKPQPFSSVGRILCALCFNRRDKVAKHGLRLLFLLKSRTTLVYIFHQVRRWASSSNRNNAMRFLRKRACQLKLQLPVKRLVLELPWCGTPLHFRSTKQLIQKFLVRLFAIGACQATVFSDGRAKCQIVWKPAPSMLDVVRSAPKFNNHLDDANFCACCCHAFPKDRWPRCKALDGTYHVCVRQSELPVPSHLDFIRRLSARTRVVPGKRSTLRDVQRGFSRTARALLDPWCCDTVKEKLEATSKEFSQLLADSWRVFDARSDAQGHHVLMADVLQVKRLCEGLFIEALDKNTSEFVCMCPRMYFLQACGLFQHHPPGNLLMIGAAYKVLRPFKTHAGNNSSSKLGVESDMLLTVRNIDSEAVDFGEFTARKVDLTDCLQPVEGTNFTYLRSDENWLDTKATSIPNLRETLQPASLNKRFKRRWLTALAGRDESWGKVRAVPKHKNLAIARPLGDQSCNPLSLLRRLLARFIDLCLKSLPTDSHFDRPTHQSVIASMEKFRDRPFEHLGLSTKMNELSNYGTLILSRDVDNGYMRIQHQEAQDAWHFISSAMQQMGRRSAWVTTSPTAKRSLHSPHGSASWTKPAGTQWVKFALEDVDPVLAFLFRHMQFCFGAARGWQTEGIMMGQAAGGAIFRLVLVAHEMRALRSQTWLAYKENLKDCSFCGIRFVDDLRIFILYPLCYGEDWAAKRAEEILMFVYPPHLVMKDDAVNPFVGMTLLSMHDSIHWRAHYKPVGEVVAYSRRYQQALLPWCSFSPPATFEAVLMGGFARCKQLSSNRACFLQSLRDFMVMITRQAGYPEGFVTEKLKIWLKHVSHDSTLLNEFRTNLPVMNGNYCESFKRPQIVFVVGRQSPTSL